MNNFLDTKTAYEDKARARLDILKSKILHLTAKSKEASADARITLNARLDELKALETKVKNQLEELNDAGQDNWEQLTAKLDGVLSAIQEKIKEVV